MKKILFLFLSFAAFAGEPIGVEWNWSGPQTGFYCNVVQIAEWIYCVKQDDRYALYVNSQNAYGHSEPVFPLLFQYDECDPQVTFKPSGNFVATLHGSCLPSWSPWVPFQKFATDGMKNFQDGRDAYGKVRLFEDPDFPILRNHMHEVIQKYIQPAPPLQERIDALVEKMGQKERIGIHVRCIPHYLGYSKSADQFLDEIEADIDQLMASKDREHTVIYLATLLDPLVKRISAKYEVVSIDLPRSQNVHADWTEIPNGDLLDRARDAIVDAWALSACDEFWCGSSNMSAFICCINPKMKVRLLPCISHCNGA